MTAADLAQRRAEVRDLQARREKFARELDELEDDAAHWNRLHPKEDPLVADPGGVLAKVLAEIDAELAVARATEGILES